MKKPKSFKKIIIISFAVTAALVIAFASARFFSKPPQTLTGADGTEYSPVIIDGDYASFFAQIDIDAEPEPVREITVTVPCDFDDFYEDYNGLQKRAGMDLARYKGMQASQLTFRLKTEREGYAVILAAEGRVIGGHRTNGDYGGEMLPLI